MKREVDKRILDLLELELLTITNWSYLTLCLACYIPYVDRVGTEYKLMILLYMLLWEELL